MFRFSIFLKILIGGILISGLVLGIKFFWNQRFQKIPFKAQVAEFPLEKSEEEKDFEEKIVSESETPGTQKIEEKEKEGVMEEEKEELEEEIILCQKGELNPARNKVIFNEIAWMGSSLDYRDEWIELKNISGKEFSLTGWQILDKNKDIKIIFDSQHKILTSGFFLLERNSDDSVPNIIADKIYSGSLNNTDEALYLFDENCQLQDEIEAFLNWPAGSKEERKSMERGENLTWHTYSGDGENGIFGTPRKENSEILVFKEEEEEPILTSLPKILISEVAAGWDQAENEFIELFNPNDFNISLSDSNFKLKLVDSNNKVTTKRINWLNNAIVPKSFFLFVAGEIQLEENTLNGDANFANQLTSVSGVIITDGKDNIIDRVSWGKPDKFPPSEAIEGQGIILENGLQTDQSLERKENQDTDDNSKDFILKLEPNPKNSKGESLVKTIIEETPQPITQTPSSSLPPVSPPTPTSFKILINEIQIAGDKASYDFIELYNPSDNPTDISDYQLKKRDIKGTESSLGIFSEGSVIPARGYFLWACSQDGYDQIINADISFKSYYLTNDNSTALFDKEKNLLDALAWGSGHTNPFVEVLAFPQNPAKNQSLERTNFQDTDNNSQDFTIQTNPTPTNSK